MKIKSSFKVTVTKKEVVVVAAQPMEDHRLQQSNLDLLLPPVDVGVFFCYKKPPPGPVNSEYATFGSIVSALKKSLSETLVFYYAFSGEMVENNAGEPELFCNNGGVRFTECFGDVELQELDLHNPDESVEGKLVPKKIHGVLAVQVTELKCGGIVIGCTFDHRVADAYSANMFLVSWAESAQSKPHSTRPSFCRSVFLPRYPGHYDQSIDNMYMLFPPPPPPRDDHNITEVPFKKAPISRIYYIDADQVLQLQFLASTGKSGTVIRRSKLEAFSAFLWKMVAKKNLGSDKKCSRLGIVVDGRSRICNNRDENQQNLMYSYFGNVLSIPFGEKSVKELNDMPLNSIANEVHKVIKMAAHEDHFLDLVDFVEAHRPQPLASTIHEQKTDEKDHDSAFVVSSGLRFPVRKMDFGWGKPVFGSYHFPWGGHAGYVMPMPSASGNGDWIVYMHLHEEEIATLEENASHVFKPFTSNYID